MEGTHYIDENVNVEETNMELWRNEISTLDKEQLIKYLHYLESEWCINATGDTHISFQLGYRKFFNPQDLNPSDGMPIRVDLESITLNQRRESELLGALFHRATALGISDKELEDERKIAERINALIEQIDDAYEIVLRNTRIYERINNPTYAPTNPEK